MFLKRVKKRRAEIVMVEAKYPFSAHLKALLVENRMVL